MDGGVEEAQGFDEDEDEDVTRCELEYGWKDREFCGNSSRYERII